MSDRMMEVARTALLQLSDVFHEHPIFQGMDRASSAQVELTPIEPRLATRLDEAIEIGPEAWGEMAWFYSAGSIESISPEITEARPEVTMTMKLAKVRYQGSGSCFNALPGELGLSSWARVYNEEDELYRFYGKCAYADPGFQFLRPTRKFKCMDAHGYTMNE